VDFKDGIIFVCVAYKKEETGVAPEIDNAFGQF
jgi:hypothetical protein